MYTCYQVVLVSEDGEYPQEDFQTELAAYNYITANFMRYGEGQSLQIKPIYRGF